MVNLIDDVQFKSSGMKGEFLKIEWMGQVTSLENFDGDGIGTFNPSDDDKVEIGAATHKIGDESYILILLTYTTSTTRYTPGCRTQAVRQPFLPRKTQIPQPVRRCRSGWGMLFVQDGCYCSFS